MRAISAAKPTTLQATCSLRIPQLSVTATRSTPRLRPAPCDTLTFAGCVCACGLCGVQVVINGQRKSQSYMRTYHGWWKDIHQDHTHLISAGQDFWFETCGHTHQWVSGNSHHRQEFQWLGTR